MNDQIQERFENDLIRRLTDELFSSGEMPEELRCYIENKYIFYYVFPDLFSPPHERALYDCRKYLLNRLDMSDITLTASYCASPPDIQTVLAMMADLRKLLMENVFLRYAVSLNMQDPYDGEMIRADIFSGLSPLYCSPDFVQFLNDLFNGINPLDNLAFADTLWRLSCGMPTDGCPISKLICHVKNSCIDFSRAETMQESLHDYDEELIVAHKSEQHI